uniref:non-specific serine/threonine protein kinase n=1 Tax=Ficedula albicollis TaxID=59894 RepID=U3KE34_FICAL
GDHCPVQEGEVLNTQYQVLHKLGCGTFATVWLCQDMRRKKQVAVKVLKSREGFAETAQDEVAFLRCVSCMKKKDLAGENIVCLLDDFRMIGENGFHILLWRVLGPSIRCLMGNYRAQGLPLPFVKKSLQQVLAGLHFLHKSCRIIHADIKPENILLCGCSKRLQRLLMDTLDCDQGTEVRLKGAGEREMRGSSTKHYSQYNTLQPAYAAEKTLLSLPNTNTRLDSRHLQKCGPAESCDTPALPSFLRFVGDFNETFHIIFALCSPVSISPMTVLFCLSNSGAIREYLISLCPFHLGGDLGNQLEESDLMSIEVKIADLGSACWTYKPFSKEIQTQPYRALEVLLGLDYGTPADIWSTACLAFEMATGERLFDPQPGKYFSRDDDHVACIIELLGRIPPEIVFSWNKSTKFFSKPGALLRLSRLFPRSLPGILVDRHGWTPREAAAFAAFLLPALHYAPERRASAAQSLRHAWIAAP